eukprot:9140936-Alexandrium_andersonii.AAC.1
MSLYLVLRVRVDAATLAAGALQPLDCGVCARACATATQPPRAVRARWGSASCRATSSAARWGSASCRAACLLCAGW